MKDLIKKINQFVDDRDWQQYHNAKDLSISISLEAAELLELYQWRSPEESNQKYTQEIREELADVLIYSFMLADKLGLDIKEIMEEKIALNELKYPVEKSKGSNKKYTEL